MQPLSATPAPSVQTAHSCWKKSWFPALRPVFSDDIALQAAKGVKAYDKAEDPIYALEHNLPIDFQHYLDHHLELPLTRLFGPVMNNPKELMTGASHLLSA